MKLLYLLYLAGLAAVPAANAGVCPDDPKAQVRESFSTFSKDPAKLKQLRRAVAALQQRDEINPTSWFALAAMHGIPDTDPRLIRIPQDLRNAFGQCHHDPRLLFLWHRAYVAAVEQLMQDAVGDTSFRLPYWEWMSDPVLPAAFREPAVGGSPNPLFVATRYTPVNNGQPVRSRNVVTDFSESGYRNFEISLFEAEHSEIHLGVGGPMAAGKTAAFDPIFFLHHANVDRLLAAWIEVDPVSHQALGNFNGWDQPMYGFPGPNGGRFKPTVAELDMSSPNPLAYCYESTATPAPITPVTPARPPESNIMEAIRPNAWAANDERPVEVGSGLTIVLPVDASVPENVLLISKVFGSPDDSALYIVFDDVRIAERVPGVLSYRVFVELDEESDADSFRDHYVGSVSLFELPEIDEGKLPMSINMRFDDRLLDSMAPAPDLEQINLSLLPELAPWASQPERPVITFKEVRFEHFAEENQ